VLTDFNGSYLPKNLLRTSDDIALQGKARSDFYLTPFGFDLGFQLKNIGMPQSTYRSNHLVLLCFSSLYLETERQETTPELYDASE